MQKLIGKSAGGICPPAPKSFRLLCAALALSATSLPAQAAAAAPQEVQAAIESSADRELRDFYRARAHRPLWLRGDAPGPEADRLLALIRNAHMDGLDPGDYKPRALEAALGKSRGGSPKALGKAETMLSKMFVRYVRDMRRARETGMVYIDAGLAPVAPKPRQILEDAAAAPSLMAYLDRLGWMNPVYGQLRAALSEGAGDAPRIRISDGPALRAGSSGERVRMLRQRLGLGGGDLFDAELAAAVERFQQARGMSADGIAGARTLAALNGGGSGGMRDERLLRLNLERARALPPAQRGRHVLVDAASARLWMYDDGRVVDSMKVVVGKPEEQTPMLAAYIRYASVNPYWNVPPDLVRRRIAPAVLDEGLGHLKTVGYQVLSDWSEKAKVIDPGRVDWKAVASGAIELPVRQLPGRDNAMGKMKFMLPNRLGIYLHDTPDKHLFREAERRFSSGCVRVEDAPRLARWLFGKPLAVPKKGKEKRVDLPAPVPVYITYLTAAPGESGIAYSEDAYGRDRSQLAARDD